MEDNALLCERCGYPLGGLPAEGMCPECGLPARESSPDRRPGSPWQQGPSARSWLVTNWGTLRHPGDRFRAGMCETRRSRWLLVVNCTLTGLLTALPWTGVLIGDPSRGASGPLAPVLSVAMLLVWTLIVGAIVFALTMVEHAGIRFFAARRRWRLSRAAAWQVCGHASAGWLVAPVAAMAVLVALTTAVRFFGLSMAGVVRLRLGSLFDLGAVSVGQLVSAGLLGASALAGVLVFETIVYVGVRACRFANAPGAGTPSAPGASSPAS